MAQRKTTKTTPKVSARVSQARKRQMQQIAKGGPQKSGVRKPATPAKAQSSQSADAKRFQQLNQSKSARDGKAQELRQRRADARAAKPAPGTGNVLKSAQEFSKDKAAKDRQVARQAAANRTAQNRQAVGKALTTLGSAAGGPKGLAAKAVLETVAPRPTAKGTVSAGGAQGPTMPKRLKEQGYAAQEKKAREKNAARKAADAKKPAAASFDDAFRDARRAKVKTFTWRGKKYTTEMK
jgi:hypothetical protein